MKRLLVVLVLLFSGALLFANGQKEQAAKSSSPSMSSSASSSKIVSEAKAFVKTATAAKVPWTGPTTGPAAVPGKFVIYVASDMTNGGVSGVAEGVKKAAEAIGWKFSVINGQGTVQGRAQALSQAIALKPNGIILGGFNATEQAQLVTEANANGIAVAGWHAAANPGPVASPKLFYNVTTPATDTAKAAAYLAIANSDGRAGVVIFTDPAFQIALAKSDAMAKIIKECSTCTLLGVYNQSLATATKDMPQVTSSLLQKYGSKWTYSLGINDLYFDGMIPALSAAGIKPSGQLYNISAGDGSVSAFQRVRDNQYQYATVAEPLKLQGWILIDELNRAFAGTKPYVFNVPVHIVVPSNVQYDGGPSNVFDPDNGYRQIYQKIWGK